MMTTNNQMELTAAIKGLTISSKNSEEITIILTDSKYVLNGIELWIKELEKKWTGKLLPKKQVKNRDLWEELDI